MTNKDEYDKIANQPYFCICKSCGSLDWILKDGTKANGLCDDGSLVKPNKVVELFAFDKDFGRGLPVCQTCEERTAIFGFRNCNKATRKALFKMNKEERLQFIENKEALYELESGIR